MPLVAASLAPSPPRLGAFLPDMSMPLTVEALDLACYVLGERSARLELDGYNSVVWHVALEACASSTL